jgi:glycosyltransferase involved in cell wall biosynthesis
MATVLWVLSALLAAQWLFALWNAQHHRSLVRLARPSASASSSVSSVLPAADSRMRSGRPQVSILIPARNEARNIEDCLRSVLAQTIPEFEVLVLDDRSEDETAAIVRSYARKDARLRLLAGSPPPIGWTGKAHACCQLAQSARAPWLFFLDADARLEPGALARIAGAAEAQGGGLLTGFPRQIVGSLAEKLIVPMMLFAVLCHLPIRQVRRSPDPRFAAAHGACIFISRTAYDAAGGHDAVRSHLVEDIALARAVKLAGYPVTLADIHRDVHMRMYVSASEVWLGYRKNLFPGLGRNPLLLGAVLALYAALYVLPPACFIAAAAGALAGMPGAAAVLLPAAAAYLLGCGIKAYIDSRNGVPALYGMLLPISAACLIALALDSWRIAATGRGYIWKGRLYK